MTGPAASDPRRPVLLVVNEEAHVRELLRVAEALLRTGDLRPVVFMEERMAGLGVPVVFAERDIEVVAFATIAIAAPAESRHVAPFAGSRWRRLKADLLSAPGIAARMPGRIRVRTGLFGKEEVEYVGINRDVMLRRAAVVRELMKSRSWASVVLCEDNVELDTGVWISVAHEFGVRCVIVPYTISNRAEFAESYVNFAPYQLEANPQNHLVGRLFPDWVYDYKQRRFMRTGFAKIVAVEQFGLAPPDPWLLNSGHADAIAVESEAMHDYYVAAGIPAGQLATTGSLTDDVLAAGLAEKDARRAALEATHKLPAGRPLLLCALPPDQNTYDRPGVEFTGFDELVGFWAERLLAVEGWNVVIRPHPKTRPERLAMLAERGLAVSYEDTAALVPLCDLYVASVSATIRWAIACGTPVLNYDVYQYGYEDYRGVDGVRLLNTRDEFTEALGNITTDAASREALASVQRRQARRWGMLDGRSEKRMTDLLRGRAS